MSPSTSSQLAWSDIPAYVWSLYLRYLVHYEPKSWVATTAYAARVLAFLLIAPLAALTILVSAATALDQCFDQRPSRGTTSAVCCLKLLWSSFAHSFLSVAFPKMIVWQ
jgi:hypothetical protein